MTKTKTPYAEALASAERLADVLRPSCERLLIAGSLRRKKPEVGDIEIVVIPRTEPVTDMFGEISGETSLLDAVLGVMGVERTKDGPKYKQFAYEGRQVDLFICSPETWPVIATIRTGSGEFSRWLVTERRKGGAKPSHMEVRDGLLIEAGKALPLVEERDFFAALGVAWVEPEDRTDDYAAQLWRGRRS